MKKGFPTAQPKQATQTHIGVLRGIFKRSEKQLGRDDGNVSITVLTLKNREKEK